jgi:hypothetical protein
MVELIAAIPDAETCADSLSSIRASAFAKYLLVGFQ